MLVTIATYVNLHTVIWPSLSMWVSSVMVLTVSVISILESRCVGGLIKAKIKARSINTNRLKIIACIYFKYKS